MSLEANFYKINNGERKDGVEDVLPPGSSKNYDESPGIRAFISPDNNRSLLQLRSIENVYAILFTDDKDEEGEILWLEEKNIALTKGQEVCIVENGEEGQAQEIWFNHTESGGLVFSKVTLDSPVSQGW